MSKFVFICAVFGLATLSFAKDTHRANRRVVKSTPAQAEAADEKVAESEEKVKREIAAPVPEAEPQSGQPIEVSSIKVTGDVSAQVFIQSSGAIESAPKLNATADAVEFTIPNARLIDALKGQLDLKQPHPLIPLVQCAEDMDSIRMKVTIDPQIKDTKKMVKMIPEAQGLRLWVVHPKESKEVLEQLAHAETKASRPEKMAHAPPAPAEKHDNKTVAARTPANSMDWMRPLGFLVGVLVVGFIAMKVLKRKRPAIDENAPPPLIEKVSYCSLAPQIGVSLLRVGKNYLLVSVTPQQVRLIASIAGMSIQKDAATPAVPMESSNDTADASAA